MDIASNKQGLLDRIARQMDCLYLSDLRNPAYIPAIHNTIALIQANEYALSEWNDAVQYITTKPLTFSTSYEARNFLLEYKNG